MKKVFYSSLFLVIMSFWTLGAIAQGTVTGKVIDSETNEALIGASIVEDGTTNGTVTNSEGRFSLTLGAGQKIIKISFIGYKDLVRSVTVKDGQTTNLGSIKIGSDDVEIADIVVVGRGVVDLTDDRKTPVAVATITAAEIKTKSIGNVEFPEILDNTPNVYVSNQSGGFGDSQMYTRGFDQSNTAFLLNGQPINGMEDGKMYWSNWAGMSDIANAVQIQRGLGSSKLAISSVGGTINIVTNTIDKNKGGSVQAIYGNDMYMKGAVDYSTGLLDNGWAFSFALSYWQADRKWARGTAGEGQSYFLSVGKIAGDHSFNFLITGAPQWHDQNYTKSDDYGNGMGYDYFGTKWNANSGQKDGDDFTWRRNYYHKPIINLNWDWDISDDSQLSTVAYASFGRGGGTGSYGASTSFFQYYNNWSTDDEGNYTAADYYDTKTGDFLFDKIVENNESIGAGSYSDGGNFLRASVNSHQWFGVVSNFNHVVSDELSYNVGVDARMYSGLHFRQAIDMMGLDSYTDTYNRYDGEIVITDDMTYKANPWAALFNYADEDERFNYDYTEHINYIGAFGQVEYATDEYSVFTQGALSTQTYSCEDRYSETKGETDTEYRLGFNLKAGGAYNITEEQKVFFNAGYYSRQPFSDNVYTDIGTTTAFVDPETENEKITGLEAGYKFGNSKVRFNFNAYYTLWANRVIGSYGEDESYLSKGVTQNHKGLEADVYYRPIPSVKLKAYVAYGDWKYDGSADYEVRDETTNQITDEYSVELTDAKVGQAPQFNTGFSADIDLLNNLSWDIDANYYDKFYGYIDPSDYTTNDAGEYVLESSDKLNNYLLVNTGITYDYVLLNSDRLRFRANVKNLFNNEYVSQEDSYGILYGTGTTFNISMKYIF